ncbi:MAG TPA: ABC transporter substrate-binding protein [Vicinamibacteria bacterium]
MWIVAAAIAGLAAAPPPARVASLNLTADEVLIEILPPSRLVGVTAFADQRGTSNIVGRVPPGVTRFPKADLERLLAAAPDLVVVSEYTDADFLHQLQSSNVRVHRMEGLGSLAGVRAAVLDLGRAVGEPEGAARLVQAYDHTLEDLGHRLAGAPRPRVLYWSGSLTAGRDTAIGALIEAAGAVNVGRELGLDGFAPIGAERAFLADADVILLGSWPGVMESLRSEPLLSKARAVREGRIVQMPTELLVTLSHHAARAAWWLGWALHPDRVPRPSP